MKYKIFAASALIALLVAVASGGTTLAALSDSEPTEDNFFYAGSVDFRIGWNQSRNNVSEDDQVPIDNPYSIFDERNITPGDQGEATIGLYNQDNPAYIQFWANQTGNEENGAEKKTIIEEETCGPITAHSSEKNRSSEKTSNISVKFKADGLGEDGKIESEDFSITVEGESKQTVYITTKSGQFKGTLRLAGENSTGTLTSHMFNATIIDIEERENSSTYNVRITSDSEKGKYSPALNWVEFQFCEPINKTSYWQLDFGKGEIPIPPRYSDGGLDNLVLAAVGNSSPDYLENPFRNYDSERDYVDVDADPSKFDIDTEAGTAIVDFKDNEADEPLHLAAFKTPGPVKPDEGFPGIESQELYDKEYTTAENGSMTVKLPGHDGYEPIELGQKKRVVNESSPEKGDLGQALRFLLWYDDGDNIKEENESVLFNGTAHELDQSEIGNGILLDGNLSEQGVQQIFNEPMFIGFKWWLPEEAKCKVQTDSKTFDFRWDAKQERHNIYKLIDTTDFLGDSEYSSDNYFQAGEFESCQQDGECGPIRGLEDGTHYSATRMTSDGNTEQVNYDVIRDSNNSVKFEDPENENLLGEDGDVESETYTIKVEGETNETVYVETKAGRFNGTAMLQGEGDTVMDTSNLWKIELVEVNDMGGYTEFKVKVTSDSEEGSASPALSHILFQFCEPLEKNGFYQIDLTEDEFHEPKQGRVDNNLFLAALSHRDDGGTRLNPSLLRKDRKPDNVELNKEKFEIKDNKAFANFEITGNDNITLYLNSFEMPGPYSGFRSPEMNKQVLFDKDKKDFAPGNHRLSVDLPTGLYPEPGSKYQNREETEGVDDNETENQSSTNQTGNNSVSSLVSHWKLDGSVGDVDDSQNVRDGDNNGAYRGKLGKINNSFEFNGDDSVKVKHSPEYELKNGTVMLWFKMNDESSNWMFSKDRDGCTLDCGHFSIAYDSFINGNGLGARIQNQGGGDENSIELKADPSIKEIKSGEWSHVTVSFGQDGAKLYVDGKLHDSNSDRDGISGNKLPIDIGRRYDEASGTGFNGNLDDVRVYNYQLNKTEINNVVSNTTSEYKVNGNELLNRSNKKYSFDGSNKEEISHDKKLELEQGTVSMSMKMDDLSSRNWIFTKDKDYCTADCGHFSIAYDSFINGNGLGVRLQKDGGNGDVRLKPDSSTDIKEGRFYDLAVSFSENSTRFYINGQLQDTAEGTPGLRNNQLPIVLGERYDGESGSGLEGNIENLRMYDRQLKDREIQKLHSDSPVVS